MITWRNPGDKPPIRFDCTYWNAWRNTESTWLKQRQLAGLEEELFDRPAADFGWRGHGTAAHQPGRHAGSGLAARVPLHPARGPEHRGSLAGAADLPVGIEPGQTVRLQVAWQAQVPRTFSRTGAIGNYFFLAQWFPKLGVFEGDGWTARQFFANTEFYADFGSYDVRLPCPRVDRRRDRPSGIADRHGRRHDRPPLRAGRRARFRVDDEPGLRGGRRAVRASDAAAGHHAAAAAARAPRPGGSAFRREAAALRYYGEWFGAYPYPQITIVDPAWQSGSGGMEYPTLFTAGTRWLAPRRQRPRP